MAFDSCSLSWRFVCSARMSISSSTFDLLSVSSCARLRASMDSSFSFDSACRREMAASCSATKFLRYCAMSSASCLAVANPSSACLAIKRAADTLCSASSARERSVCIFSSTEGSLFCMTCVSFSFASSVRAVARDSSSISSVSSRHDRNMEACASAISFD